MCDEVMSDVCERTGQVCCHYMTRCALYTVSWDEAICAGDCGEWCMLDGRVSCVFRPGGDRAYTLLKDSPGGFGYFVQPCPNVS